MSIPILQFFKLRSQFFYCTLFTGMSNFKAIWYLGDI